MSHHYYVYILTNSSGTLYTGMTGNLKQRIFHHKQRRIIGFTQKYNVTKLIYFETFQDVTSAITREKAIKGWIRQKKVNLINKFNPDWDDLSSDL